MPFEIKNNRLLIILPNQQNASILNLHSKLSHICRKILKVAVSILCCKGCRNQNGPDENGKIHDYYSFETFEAKIEDKIYYISKQQYFNLKRAINPHPRYIQNFSEDLLRTTQDADVNIQKNAPKVKFIVPDAQPQVSQEPLPLNQPHVKKVNASKANLNVPDAQPQVPQEPLPLNQPLVKKVNAPKAHFNAPDAQPKVLQEPNVDIQNNAPKANLNVPDVQPQVPQAPLPLNQPPVKQVIDNEKEMQESVKDAQSLLRFMSKSRHPYFEILRARLATVKKEVFENLPPKANFNMPDAQPKVLQEPLPLNQPLVKKFIDTQKEIQDSVKDAESFLKFMSESRDASDEMWMNRLAIIKKEVFEKAVVDFEKSPEPRKAVYQKLYLLSSNDQHESLINLLAYPEYLAASYPRDVELRTKVANKIFADPNHLKQLFEQIDQDADLKGFLLAEFIPLVEELLKKFPDDLQILSEAGKNNAFGFNLNPSFDEIGRKGMINVIFQKLPYEKAETILLSTIHSAEFTTGFGLKLLTQALKELNPENDQHTLSNELIQFAFRFLDKMIKAAQESGKFSAFLKEMLDYNDNGPMRTNMETFINCFTIAALRSQSPEIMLNVLMRESLYMIDLTPKVDKPNDVLEMHLTLIQKQNYIRWARNCFFTDDARFRN